VEIVVAGVLLGRKCARDHHHALKRASIAFGLRSGSAPVRFHFVFLARN
jgi:hypothetical protein